MKSIHTGQGLGTVTSWPFIRLSPIHINLHEAQTTPGYSDYSKKWGLSLLPIHAEVAYDCHKGPWTLCYKVSRLELTPINTTNIVTGILYINYI